MHHQPQPLIASAKKLKSREHKKRDPSYSKSYPQLHKRILLLFFSWFNVAKDLYQKDSKDSKDIQKQKVSNLLKEIKKEKADKERKNMVPVRL